MKRHRRFPQPGEQPEPRNRSEPDREVQRPLQEMPIMHLEPEVPTVPESGWTLTIDGLAARPRILAFEELLGLESFGVTWDFHCVWGWSCELVHWSGVSGAAIIELAGIDAPYVTVGGYSGAYASALTREEFATGMLATHLEGQPLPAERGGPLRYIPCPGKWAYKGVKWLSRVTPTQAFVPGFWEQAVGNPHGDIPPDREDLRFER